jgi:YrbI family 3-deoxy-D-manno-octulosonate 8-phosphate phosphatase
MRAKKVKADHCYINIKQKEKMLSTICKKFNVKPENIGYIGDDINDLKIMKRVGLSATPYDAAKQVRLISDLKCKRKGGNGVFREFADFILKN